MRVVLDSNVVMAGMLWEGGCSELLMLAAQGIITPYTSRELLDEIEEVLHRPRHAKQIARTGLSAAQLFRQYQRLAICLPARKLTKQVCRDADDDAVLACALAAKAEIIITGDKDLQVLHPWQNIHILSPKQVLARLDGNGS